MNLQRKTNWTNLLKFLFNFFSDFHTFSSNFLSFFTSTAFFLSLFVSTATRLLNNHHFQLFSTIIYHIYIYMRLHSLNFSLSSRGLHSVLSLYSFFPFFFFFSKLLFENNFELLLFLSPIFDSCFNGFHQFPII